MLLSARERGIPPPVVSDRIDQEMMSKRMEQESDPVATRLAKQEKKRREAAMDEEQFVDRFNRFVRTIADFSIHYNTNHTVDLKRIKALKKAWRNLEKTNAWFKIDENGGVDSSEPKNTALPSNNLSMER
jgi:hypothetical protein